MILDSDMFNIQLDTLSVGEAVKWDIWRLEQKHGCVRQKRENFEQQVYFK